MAKRRASGDGMVRKRENGRWEGRIVVGHKRNGEPIFRSVYARAQKELLDKLHREIVAYEGVELTEDSLMTLGDWLDRWLDEYAANALRHTTLENYRHMAERVRRELGDKQVSSVTTEDVQRMYRPLRERGRLVTGATKTGSGTRDILLADSTAELLRKRMETSCSEWIFPNPKRPELPLSPSSAYSRLVVLYFYPRDNTPGCTRQVCAFAKSYEGFQSKDVVVIGASKDSVASHQKFAEKYALPSILLSDPER